MKACHVVIPTNFLFYLIVSTKCLVKDIEIVNIKGISIESKFYFVTQFILNLIFNLV